MTHTPPIEHAHGILILLRRLKRACANVQTHQNLRFWNTDFHLSHHMIFWNCDESLGEPVLQSIFCLQKWHRNLHLREHEILTLIALWSDYGFGESAYLRWQFRLSLRNSIKMSRVWLNGDWVVANTSSECMTSLHICLRHSTMRLRRRVCTCLRGVARVFVTGQCVKYQKVVLTQMVIWFTFMLETKAPRSLHIVQSTGLDLIYLLAFAFSRMH